ncbi:putative quinol monooxygenase [Haloarchaeobius sp. FL176]|uniref:putative quinol monooxygenase n=1 Tax=Haloarchaeobius sp. FL176 TaxID=2967129 RepID=UPI0021472386|nr:putative quinol monooxygenase [Haloarchaeobius sp. FL176]
MYVVLTSIPIDPARRTEALELVAELAEQSRAEPGVVAYHATTDVVDPNVVRFVERYEDVAALETHTETGHYERFTDRLPAFVDGEMETTQLRVDDEVLSASFGVDDLD